MNITKKEFIGKIAEVIDSTNKSNIGIKGIIRDETKYLIMIENKKLIKKNITIKINNVTIKGKQITKRPEERIKK